MSDFLRAAMARTWRSKLGYLFARRAFRELRDKLDPRKSNGGVLLGLNGVVVKSHGGTDAEGFAYAVDVGYEMVRYDLLTKINQMLNREGGALGVGARGGCLVTLRSVVLGCGAYLPQRILTNAELASQIDTSDEWIVQRTGIRERHIAADDEFTSHLAIKAANAALANAGIDAQAIDLIVLATSTPDNTFPATAVAVQNGLGITRGAAFDLQAVCSGFVFALATADNFLRAGAFKRALVIGAETFSRILDWNDRGTCVLFGDGAGAIVLEAQEQPGQSSDRGILTTHLRSDGRHKAKLFVDGGPGSTKTVGHLRMEGREVFKHAVGMITDVIVDAFNATGLHGRRHHLVRPASGQQANHRCQRAQAAYCAAEGGADRRPPRQHLGRIDPAGTECRGEGRAREEGRSRAVRGHGRRLHLGFRAGPLVRFRQDCR